METLVYPYRQKIWIPLAAIAFFGWIAFDLSNDALHKNGSLRFMRLITLSPQETRIFYWCLVAASLALVCAGFWGLITRFLWPLELTVAADRLVAPKSIFNRTLVEIPYATITGTDVSRTTGQRFLNVYHAGGRLRIPETMMPSRKDFEALSQALTERGGQAGRVAA